MPGTKELMQGAQPVEFTIEDEFADPVADNVDWDWIGAVTSFDVNEQKEVEEVRYLPDDATGLDLQTLRNVPVSEAFELEATFHPQNNDFLQHFTGAVGDTDPSLDSLQFGMQDRENDEYRRALGGVGEEITVAINEDSVVENTASFPFADVNDDGTDDYVGTEGSHATEDPSELLTYDDLGNVEWGGEPINDAISSLEISISNDLEIVKDIDSELDSHIVAIVPTSREITVDIEITYDDWDFMRDVRSYTPEDLTFDLDGDSFTIEDVAFPEAPYEFSPEDLVADSLTSDAASGITWA